MKNFEYPEFFILNRLEALVEKYADNEDILTLKQDVRKIINENSLFSVKSAMVYTLMGESDLSADTKKKLKMLFKNSLNMLEKESDA